MFRSATHLCRSLFVVIGLVVGFSGTLRGDDPPADEAATEARLKTLIEQLGADGDFAARRDKMPDPDAAIASLDEPNDNDRIAGWIGRFLRS